MAKSCVVPLRTLATVPRLELTAGFYSAQVANLLQEELDIEGLTWRFWVDNTIVLGYIQNDTKRFRVYVANRVRKIRQITGKDVWSYVPTDENPADDASRGMSTADTDRVHRWFHGPAKLRESDCDTVTPMIAEEITDDDPEVVQCIKCNLTLSEKTCHLIIDSLGERVSSWVRIVRLVGALIGFARICSAKSKNHTSVEDVVNAEEQLYRLIQAKHFPSEVAALKAKKSIARSSHIRKLRPFLDEAGVLRVGGRLGKAKVPDKSKNPVILPKKEAFVTRIVQWCHAEVEHLGRTSTLGEVRNQGFWLLSAHDQVSRVIHKCVRCRVLRGMPEKQKMGELPESRSEDAPPFSYCGVDLFGPFIVKERRSEVKRYGVIFTCFGCRAIHLETTTSLDTDTFILSLRRFIGRRGPVRSIKSDNGGNFVGADNEMRRAMKEMDQKRIKECLLSEHCDLEWVD